MGKLARVQPLAVNAGAGFLVLLGEKKRGEGGRNAKI